jgi:plastocyanin
MDRFRGRRRLLTLAIGLLVVSAAPFQARAATDDVDEVGTSFEPSQVSIGVNDRVVWTNRSTESHTVTFDDLDLNPRCNPNTPPLLRVGCQAPGSTVERPFTSPGTYAYYCKIHRSANPPMRGVVVVTAPTTTLAPTTSSTLPRATTTSSTAKASTSSTTATTRPLATSSTLGTSSTTSTTSDTSSVLLPGDPPPFSGDDVNSAAGRSGGSDDGSDSGIVVLIVGLLLAVSAGGGYLLWRLRPGRA